MRAIPDHKELLFVTIQPEEDHLSLLLWTDATTKHELGKLLKMKLVLIGRQANVFCCQFKGALQNLHCVELDLHFSEGRMLCASVC